MKKISHMADSTEILSSELKSPAPAAFMSPNSKTHHATFHIEQGRLEQYCALKRVTKEMYWEHVDAGRERGDAILREVLSQMLLSGQHLLATTIEEEPFIPFVQIFGVFETRSYFGMELELMESRDLFDRLATDGPMSEEHVRYIMAQIIDAISLCHRLGIAHRDIKLSNITFPRDETLTPQEEKQLLETRRFIAQQHAKDSDSEAENSDSDADDDDSYASSKDSDSDAIIVKLADFGMAGFIGPDKRLKGRCGTPGYVAPEILHSGLNEHYSFNVDIFSVSP